MSLTVDCPVCSRSVASLGAPMLGSVVMVKHSREPDGALCCPGSLMEVVVPPPEGPLIKLCNCAGSRCGKELLGDSLKAWYDGLEAEEREELPEPVAGRVGGRPYCTRCLKKKMIEARGYNEVQWKC